MIKMLPVLAPQLDQRWLHRQHQKYWTISTEPLPLRQHAALIAAPPHLPRSS